MVGVVSIKCQMRISYPNNIIQYNANKIKEIF